MKAIPILAFILASCAALPTARTEADLIIHNARIVDTERESAGAPMTLVIEGGKVIYAGSKPTRLRARRTVDARGDYVLPGLWDMHVHALWSDGLWPIARDSFLAHCITGVRDMGGKLDELARARKDKGPAPELIAAGLVLDGPHPVDPDISIAVTNASEADEAVDRIVTAGADFVKVYTLLSPDAFAGIVASANERQMDLAGHVPYGVDILTAAASMKSIEHMQAETGLYCDPARKESCRAPLAAFKAHRSWQTPTLAARSVRAHNERISADDLKQWSGRFPATAIRLWSADFDRWAREDAATIARKRQDFDNERRLARLLVREEVPILAGSDSGIPMVPFGKGLARELQLLVESGATPAKALRSAIVEPAKYLRRNPSPSVSAGSEANFCIVSSNPLKDIVAASWPWLTVVRGRIGFERSPTAMIREGT